MIEAGKPQMIEFGLALRPNLPGPRRIVRSRLDEVQTAAAEALLGRGPIRVVRDHDCQLIGRLICTGEKNGKFFSARVVFESERCSRRHRHAGNAHVRGIKIDPTQILNRGRESYRSGAYRLFLFPVESQIKLDVALIVIVLRNILRWRKRTPTGLNCLWRRCRSRPVLRKNRRGDKANESDEY